MSDQVARNERFEVDKTIKIIASTIIIFIILSVLSFPVEAKMTIDYIRTMVTKYLNWYFTLFASVLLFFSAWLIFGRYGKVLIGGKGAKPEFSRFSWFSMLFACGQGIGLIFWGIAEPIMMFDSDKFAEARSLENINWAMSWTYFHWGIHAWAIYCVAAVCLAFSIHNAGKPLTFRDSIDDILPKKFKKTLGVSAEVTAILATVLGLSTSFGFAIMQFGSGLKSLVDINLTASVHMTIIVVFTLIVAYSVWGGVNKGVKFISELNSILSIVLIATLLFFGPTNYLLSLFVESLGHYLDNMLYMGFWNDSSILINGFDKWEDSWSGWWTLFIWCWTFSFASFTGCFIAQISKGRTIREFMIGVILVPALIVIVWVCITGGSAIFYDIRNGGVIAGAVAKDSSLGLTTLFSTMNIKFVSGFLTIMTTVLIATYYVSSLDSGILVLSDLVSSYRKVSKKFKMLLLGLVSGIALVLFTLGGADAMSTVQIAAIISAVPFSILLFFMCISFLKRLKTMRLYYVDSLEEES